MHLVADQCVVALQEELVLFEVHFGGLAREGVDDEVDVHVQSRVFLLIVGEAELPDSVVAHERIVSFDHASLQLAQLPLVRHRKVKVGVLQIPEVVLEDLLLLRSQKLKNRIKASEPGHCKDNRKKIELILVQPVCVDDLVEDSESDALQRPHS